MHDRIEWPSVKMLAGYLCDLANEPLDEVSRAKYEADARAILAFIQSEIVIRDETSRGG